MERNIQINWQEIVTIARKTRKEQKISQARLAALCGISTPTVSHFENGKRDIKVSTALSILEALGLSVPY